MSQFLRAFAVLAERMGVQFPGLTFATHYQVLIPTPWKSVALFLLLRAPALT